MRFLSFIWQEKTYAGVMTANAAGVIRLETILPAMQDKTLLQFIQSYEPGDLDTIRRCLTDAVADQCISLTEVTVVAPISRPAHDVLCIGENYAAQIPAEGMKRTNPAIYFTKRANRILGHEDTVEGRFDLDIKMDYEVELAVILGKGGRDIAESHARDHIFGYSVLNDLSSRELQTIHTQWFKGKSIDGYTAMGPVIVTADEFAYPPAVDVICRVNGQVRQRANTACLMTDISGIIQELSAGMTLDAGDIIATGTPAGIGISLNPSVFLAPGDVVECEVPEIGVLRNYIR